MNKTLNEALNEEVIEIKKDCFAYREVKGRCFCVALNKLYCKKEKCRFYKKDICDNCNYKDDKDAASCTRCELARKGVRYF